MAKTAVHLSDNTWQYITDRTPQGEQKGYRHTLIMHLSSWHI